MPQATTELNTPEAPFCIGCANATAGQIPYQVSLQRGDYGTHFCGGSVVSATSIATAAHCKQQEFFVVAGTIDINQGERRQGLSFTSHPAFNIRLCSRI